MGGNQGEADKEFTFTARDFARVRQLIHRQAGIALADSKREMVYSRLARRLRAHGVQSFSDYLDRLEQGADPREWEAFTNALTTNLTAFFREEHHFPTLAALARQAERPFSVWCAASSTGEEPYSIAITLCEAMGSLSPRASVVATDIDTSVLATAEEGIYPLERVGQLGQERMKRFFLKGRGSQQGMARVRPELRRMVSFARLNLLDGRWPLQGPFDAIFCRNVMIYFDKPTQARILEAFAPLLKPHGLLFVGHSENLSYVSSAFSLHARTVYQLARAAPGGKP